MQESGSGTRSQRINPGPFLISIDGLPTEYTWKDLKDLVRPIATRNLWADVLHSSKRGCIRLSTYEEAHRAYEYLSLATVARKPLRVELWDITNSDSRPTFMDRNYNPAHGRTPAHVRDVERLVRDTSSRIPASPVYPSQTLIPMTVAASLPPPAPVLQSYAMHPMTANIGLQQPAPVQYFQQFPQYYAQQVPAQQHMAQQSPMAFSSEGLPINMRNGGAKTEARAVFVSQLSYKAKEPQLEAHFSKAGKVISCQIKRDAKTRKSKGYAHIEYGSIQEAIRAIDLFNDSEFMGMQLHVRADKDRTTIVPPRSADPGPLIVNGSMSYRSSRSSR